MRVKISRSSSEKPCAVTGCTKPLTYYTELCNMHYLRKSRKGSATASSQKDKRPAVVQGVIAKIPIGLNAKDGYAIVDIEDAWVDQYNWWLGGDHNGKYAKTWIGRKQVRMHHMVFGRPPGGQEVDHENRNKLDNRKSNLSFVTRSINTLNRPLQSNNISGYRGVSWDKRSKKYRWKILRDGIAYEGRCDCIQQAAIQYDIASIQLYGNHAQLNIL